MPFLDPAHGLGRGLAPASTNTYKFVNSDIEWAEAVMREIRAAFKDWSRQNEVSGLNTKFNEITTGTPTIELIYSSVLDDDTFGLSRWTLQPNGRDANTGTIRINAKSSGPVPTQFVSGQLTNWLAFRKAGLHEIGHWNGLDDNVTRILTLKFSGRNESTVMNYWDGTNDPTRNGAPHVTPCDRERARLATTRPWP